MDNAVNGVWGELARCFRSFQSESPGVSLRSEASPSILGSDPEDPKSLN